MKRARSIPVVVSLVAVAALAGCGDEDDSEPGDARSTEASTAAPTAQVTQAELLKFPLDVEQPGSTKTGAYGPPNGTLDLGQPPVPCEPPDSWPGQPKAWLASDAFGPVEQDATGGGGASDSRRLVVYGDVAAADAAFEELWSKVEACHSETITDRSGSETTQQVSMRKPKVGDEAVAWWYGAGEMAHQGTIVITRAGTALLSVSVGEESTATDLEDRVDDRARAVVAKICAEDWAGCGG